MVSVNGNTRENALIQVRNLDKKYVRGGEEIHVLQGLNLNVEEGEFVAFMGPSGSGKTTLLNLLGGLDVPSAGSITVAGDEVTHMSGPKLTTWRARHVGFIFQMYNLIPVLTAFQNVEMPLLLTSLTKAERRQHVEMALARLTLPSASTIIPGSSRAARSSAFPLPGQSWPTPRFFCAMSPQATSTATAPMKSSTCLKSFPQYTAKPFSWSPMTRAPQSAPARCCILIKESSSRAKSRNDLFKFFPLLVANLLRKKTRSALTMGSFAVALFLFSLLGTIDSSFNQGVEVAGADRLLVMNKTSLVQPLPVSYMERIQQIRGVKDVTYATWFGGIYKDEKNFFAQMVIDHKTFCRCTGSLPFRRHSGATSAPTARAPLWVKSC